MGQRAIITVPLRWSFWGILVKYDSLRLSIVAWERPFLMNFDDRMGSCRDKGRMWGRVGAWCLSWWQRAPLGLRGANRPHPNQDKHQAQYISLKAKKGKKKTESSKSGTLPESKKTRSFRCTDYARWMSMTRCVNR